MSKEFKPNSIRGPVNAWIFETLTNYMDRLFGDMKKELFMDHPDTIVEIGPGSGANMRYMRRGTRLIAIEPNVHMHSNLKKNADKYGLNLEIKTLVGEAIDLPSESFDFVVSTLVLCSVENPVQCIVQIKRILKPAGVFIFLEHVKSSNNSIVAWIQDIVHKPWHWFFEGCNTNRNTQRLLELSGFTTLHLEAYNIATPFIPIIPQIRGRAIK